MRANGDVGRWANRDDRSAGVTSSNLPTRYGKLARRNLLPPPTPIRSSEDELDSLIRGINERATDEDPIGAGLKADPLDALRDRMLREFVPVFVELLEKYGDTGLSLQMDASNFLEGGREIRFEFGLGEYRVHLLGTVTSDAIAFHETRHSPDVHGELVSGPMLRLRGLDADVFRRFVCERLTILVRAVIRRR